MHSSKNKQHLETGQYFARFGLIWVAYPERVWLKKIFNTFYIINTKLVCNGHGEQCWGENRQFHFDVTRGETKSTIDWFLKRLFCHFHLARWTSDTFWVIVGKRNFSFRNFTSKIHYHTHLGNFLFFNKFTRCRLGWG